MSTSGNRGAKARFSRGGIALAIVFALALLATSALGVFWASPAQAAESVTYSDQELQFARLLNDYRVSKGLQPLLLSDTISVASDRHNSDMGTYDFFNHYTQHSSWFPVGSSPFYRMNVCGYDSDYMGEIIAAGYPTAGSVFEGWKWSPDHNVAMLTAAYKVMGVSQVYVTGSPYGWYWTVDFGGYIDPSAHGDGLYQQNDPKLTYLGTWNGAYQWPASGGSFRWADSRGAAVMVSFTGTSVALIGKMASNYGMAQVTLDGGAPVAVDFYSPTALYQKRVHEWTDLADTPHTLLIECVRDKNPASAGYLINVDALDISGSLTQAPLPVRKEQSEPLITYSGTWATSSNNWSCSGGSLALADSEGEALAVSFNGTYLAWVAKTAPWYGKALVRLDDGEPFYVDLYSGSQVYKRCVYNTGKLTDGPHTLYIYWSGLKNAAASGHNLSVDAFDILGELTEAPAAPPTPALYQQSDSRLTYLGSWAYARQAPALGGSFNHTTAAGAAVMVSFTGTSVALIGKMASNYGMAQVTLDGGAPVAVDFYSPTALYQQRVYEREGLDDTAHTLSIEWVDDKNPASTGYLVNIDAIEIMGCLDEACKPIRYQQENSLFSYTPGWATSSNNWSCSGGSLALADASGEAVTVSFEGTYLAWVAKTAPWYGKALVSLDGGEPLEVDLYSASQVYKRCVYNTGPLEEGPHTLTIYWSGLKNAASSGYNITIDALDILGEPVAVPVT